MKNIILLAGLASLVLVACEKENKECPGAIEQNFPLTGFTRINAGGSFTVTVSKGNDFSIKAKGCADDLADLDLEVATGQFLELKFDDYKPNRYRVDFTITLPQLVSLNLSGESKGTVSGFQGQNTVIRNIVSGEAECTLNGTGVNAQVELSGKAILNLSGVTENLYGTVSGDAKLNAFDVAATEVDINVSGSSRSYVQPLQNFFAEASSESRVYYRGNPPVRNFVTSGNGKIIKQ